MKTRSAPRHIWLPFLSTRGRIQELVAARDAVADAISFFEPGNLERFARWADQNRFDDCRYTAKVDRIAVILSDGKGTEIARPATLMPVADNRFDHLYDTMVSFTADAARKKGGAARS
jgi:hypothetical protein